jgi:hypothetical protein
MSLVAILTTTVAAPPAQAGPSAAGRVDAPRIVLQRKPDFALWDAERKIAPGAVGLAYEVERSDRLHLLLRVPADGLRGWARAGTVIAVPAAEAFFTSSITIRPDDPFGYFMRAVARSLTGNADGAIADLDEAIKRMCRRWSGARRCCGPANRWTGRSRTSTGRSRSTAASRRRTSSGRSSGSLARTTARP